MPKPYRLGEMLAINSDLIVNTEPPAHNT